MKKKNKGKIAYVLQAINILPLLFFGLVILLVGTYGFREAMYSQVETELSNVSHNLETMYNALYPGDYSLQGDKALRFYKGTQDLTNDFSLIDQIKESTGLDVTIFYSDTRILTTITDKNGERIIGSGAPATVLTDVLATGEACFYNKTIIYGVNYFSYYAPLKNQDGSVAGMLFVGKPSRDVDAAVHKSIYPLIIADVVLVLIVSVFTFLYTRSIVASLLQIHCFLGQVSSGNMNATLDSSSLKRGDELGDIARSAVEMQRSLRSMVEQDVLTGLANRRSGLQKLRQIMERASGGDSAFCVAIGDIDFFKRVNDTYGHECGDLVLKNVSAKLRQHMQGRGIAARWGGEEFLLAFEDMDITSATNILHRLLEDIRSMESRYDGKIVKITMTVGIVQGGAGDDMTALLRTADDRLYQGKSSGKDRIVP